MRKVYFLHVDEKFYNKKDLFNAASKAKDDIHTIVRNIGLPIYSMRKNTTKVKMVNLLLDAFRYLSVLSRIEFTIKKGSVLIVQRRLSFTKARMLSGILRLKKCRMCVIIHDINSIRFGAVGSEIKCLNKAEYLIVHTAAMKEKLVSFGVEAEMIVLDVFDYVTDKSHIAVRRNSNKIVFAGNLGKTAFLPFLQSEPELDFNFYGFEMPQNLAGISNITYKGRFVPTHVCDIEGSWGLVWDGDSIDTCSGLLGNYLSYIAPHKCSLYIAAHLPLIVWENSAMARFVKDNGIGICVSSVAEISDRISAVSDELYAQMQSNLRLLSKKLGNGEQVRNAIGKIGQ